MSTPEGPGELRLAAGQAPTTTQTPTVGAPTPGVALAGARVPGAPTVPDWDPMTLTTLVQRMANELFTAPPSPEPGTPDAAVKAAGASTSGAPSPGSPMAAGPTMSGEPPPTPPTVTSMQAPPASATQVPAAPASGLSLAPGASTTSLSLPTSLPGVTSLSLPSTAAPSTSSVPSRSSVATPQAPPTSSLSSTAASAPVPSAVPGATSFDVASSPFSAPLDFAAFTGGLGFPELSVPLLDLPTAATREASLPSGSAPIAGVPDRWPPTSDSAPRPTISIDDFQVSPTARPTPGGPAGGGLDPLAVRRDFPILEERVHGKRLVWLDNAATTQKPRAVIDRLSYFYEHENSNIHRAAHTLAARATDAYENARDTVARFIGAPSSKNIIFVRGTTEGINLVAAAWGRANVGAGDEVVISWLEHHANIVPWQMLCAETGARLRVAPVDDDGQIIVDEYARLLNPRTKLVAFSQVSNALGTITPSGEMIALAHRAGARVLLDGAQSVSHLRTNVAVLDCDFFVFSGHKVFAPTGIGVVYGKRDVLDGMGPYQGGGNMIADVTFEHTTFQPPPARFEAGTGNIADAVGLGAALDWLSRVGVDAVGAYEHALLEYATTRLHTVPGLRMIGTAAEKAGVLSFVLDGQKTEDVGRMLDEDGIAVRSGHHCAQPILRRFGVEATVRASLAPYNTVDDIDCLVAALHRLQANRATTSSPADRRQAPDLDDPSP